MVWWLVVCTGTPVQRAYGPAQVFPSQTASGGATNVRIEQTKQTALLSWQTYNVGRKTTLHYDQSSAARTRRSGSHSIR